MTHLLVERTVCGNTGCGPHGAQTERRGGAGPVGGLLGGQDPTDHFFYLIIDP
jgi:hypothetical protein